MAELLQRSEGMSGSFEVALFCFYHSPLKLRIYLNFFRPAEKDINFHHIGILTEGFHSIPKRANSIFTQQVVMCLEIFVLGFPGSVNLVRRQYDVVVSCK